MGQTQAERTENLAARRCWEGARRDAVRIARRLYRQAVGAGVYRLDAGAWLDAFFHVLRGIGVMARLEEVHGTAIQRELLPDVPSSLLDGFVKLLRLRRWPRSRDRPLGLNEPPEK